MKAQTCRYKTDKGSGWSHGVAILKDKEPFGLHDIVCIIDQDGKKVKTPWDYRLIEGPMCYIDTEYQT